MTELLYQTDSYLQEFDAVVTAVDPEARWIKRRFTLAVGGSRMILENSQRPLVWPVLLRKLKNRVQMYCIFWATINPYRRLANPYMGN